MHTSPQVPLLRTATQVADWLDASYPHAVNGAALARIEDHIGRIKAMRLWSAGVRIIDNRPDNDPQGATCPDCGRHTAKLIDGRLEAHTIPGVYDRLCHQGGK